VREQLRLGPLKRLVKKVPSSPEETTLAPWWPTTR
jgi:hypothetical protein